MWRTGRGLTVLVAGWVAGLSLLLAPVAAASPAVQQPAAAVRVQAAPAPQGHGAPSFSQAPEQQPPSAPPDRQRVTTGVAGIVLIALVLLTRKWRKKPMVPMPKIPKFWKNG